MDQDSKELLYGRLNNALKQIVNILAELHSMDAHKITVQFSSQSTVIDAEKKDKSGNNTVVKRYFVPGGRKITIEY